MANLVSLPAELLLDIVSHLTPSSLFSLALVHRKLSPIALEKPYQNPGIEQPNDGHRLMCLVRTLLTKPGALERVQTLSIAVVDRTIPFDKNSHWLDAQACLKKMRPRLASNVAAWEETLEVFETTGEDAADTAEPYWCADYCATRKRLVQRLQASVPAIAYLNAALLNGLIVWSQSAYYAALLALLPNLRSLTIATYDNSLQRPTETTSMLYSIPECLLLGGYRDTGALQNLQHLEIVNGEVHRPWLYLPSLRSLTLGIRTDVLARPNVSVRPSAITKLDVSLDFGVLMHGSLDRQPEYFKDFLSAFKALADLKIHLGSWYGEGGFPAEWGRTPTGFDVLLEAIKVVRGTLETLDIEVDARYENKLDGVASMTRPTSADFPRLRTLYISERWLLRSMPSWVVV